MSHRLIAFLVALAVLLHVQRVFAAPALYNFGVGDVLSDYTERALRRLASDRVQPCDFKCANSSLIPEPNPSWIPVFNGCGTADTFTLLPKYNFTGCCNTHDLCYSTCGKSKALCDLEFLSCMLEQCDVSMTLPVFPPLPLSVAANGTTFNDFNSSISGGIGANSTNSTNSTTDAANSTAVKVSAVTAANSTQYSLSNSPVMNPLYLAMIMFRSQNARYFNETSSLLHMNKNFTFADADKYDTSTHNVIVLHRDYLKTEQTVVRTKTHKCPLEARLFHLAVASFGCDAYLGSQDLACSCR